MCLSKKFLPASLSIAIAGGFSSIIPASSAHAAVLEEVTVTARRRVESLQETPLSVVALSSEALEQQNVNDLSALDVKFPNVAAGGSGGLGGSNASFFIRGIGTDRNAVNQETAIALYVDDTYYGRTDGALLSVLDVEGIEVSRGPQGTLFGRSATGGAIRYKTKKPEDEFGGKIQLNLGTDNRRDVKAVLNAPINDDMAVRFTAASLNQDGYVKGALSGIDYGDTNSDLIRAQLRWDLSPDVEVLASVDYTRMDTNGAPSILVGVNTGAPFVLAEASNGFDAGSVPVGDYATSYQTGKNFYKSQNEGANLSVKWALSEEIDFQSSTSIRQIDVEGAYDTDATPAALFEQDFERDIEMFSQEFQFSGSADYMEWVAGVFYYREEATDNRLVLVTANSTPNRSSTRIVDPYTVDSYAVFGQASFDLAEQWSLTAGARYTYDDKSISANELRGSGAARLLNNVERSKTWGNVSGRLSLDYQASDDVFFFGSYARGFRSGGFNDRIRTDTGPANFYGITDFDQETLDMFELGMRSDLFESQLRLNITAFYGQYTDMQISSLLPGTTRNVIQNIGESRLFGLESEVTFALNEVVTLDASFGWLEAEYTKIDLPSAAVSTNSEFGRAPKRSYSLGISADWDTIVARIDYGWKDDFRSVVPDANIIQQQAYGLLSANLSYQPDDSQWKLALYGSNLTDEEYLVSGISLLGSNPTGIAQVEPGRGRELGIKINWNL